MPSVFLSYASQDEPSARAIEQALTEKGILVWRDKTNLHAGDRWPKRLGEAIAEKDFFLLLWSNQGPESDFVDLEWTTALALKKTILLLLLDETFLPPALSAIHGISGTDLSQAVPRLIGSLTQATPQTDHARTSAVVTKLGEIPSQKPDEVLHHAKAMFEQSNWSVQGNVYQAVGDVHVTNVSSAPPLPEKQKKHGVEKWLAWVGLGVATLTLIGLLVDVPTKIMNVISTPGNTQPVGPPSVETPSQPKNAQTPVNMEKERVAEEPKKSAKRDTPKPQQRPPMAEVLSGLVSDQQTGEPVKGVLITAPQFNLSVSTNGQGHFKLKVEHPDSDRVLLVAQKDGYETYRTKATLGNTSLGFALRRLP